MLIRTVLGDAYYFAREYEKSVFHYRMSIELDPRFDGAHTDLARSLEALGRFDEARAAYEEGRRLVGWSRGTVLRAGASRGGERATRRRHVASSPSSPRRARRAWSPRGDRRGAREPRRRGRGVSLAGDRGDGEGDRG